MDSTNGTIITISVVTPFHRIADLDSISSWIPAAIEMGIEVILVLDSLDENEISLVKTELQNNFNRLKVSIGDFGSAARSRNAGIAQATGEWIAFWDADDRPILRNFTQMIAESKNYSVAKGSFSRVTEKENEFEKYGEFRNEVRTMRSVYRNASNPGLWRWAFRRKLIENIYFPEIILGEDQLFLIEALSTVNEYLYSTYLVYEYNDLNLSSITNMEYKASNFINSLRISAKRAQKVIGVKAKLHLYLFMMYQIRSAVKAYFMGKREE